jgi:hypothetical protein
MLQDALEEMQKAAVNIVTVLTVFKKASCFKEKNVK